MPQRRVQTFVEPLYPLTGGRVLIDNKGVDLLSFPPNLPHSKLCNHHNYESVARLRIELQLKTSWGQLADKEPGSGLPGEAICTMLS